jgi:CelD/BcsL family acetyltransferase involved in cellulose biosynthesis
MTAIDGARGGPGRLEPIDFPEWRDAWWSSNHATFFQSPMWAQTWCRYLGGSAQAVAWRALLDDGSAVILPALGSGTLGGLTRRYQLSPAGTYGGPFADHLLAPDLAIELVRRLRSPLTEGSWRWSPFAVDGLCSWRRGRLDDTTRVLDLGAGEAELRRRWSKGHRAAARQAERLGVEVRIADDDAHWAEYDELYRESLERWGDAATSRYEPALFEALREHGRDQARLWVASVRGELAAGAICLYSRQHVSYWHGAARERLLEFRPVHLLIEVALHDACERGLRWFDFNPSGGHPGVEAFKKGFGADTLPAPLLRWESLFRPLRDLRRRLGRRSAGALPTTTRPDP